MANFAQPQLSSRVLRGKRDPRDRAFVVVALLGLPAAAVSQSRC